MAQRTPDVIEKIADLNNPSPMMAQYIAVKEQYPDHILMYRLGDFYEMFFEDAVTVSRELELTLTGRDCGDGRRAANAAFLSTNPTSTSANSSSADTASPSASRPRTRRWRRGSSPARSSGSSPPAPSPTARSYPSGRTTTCPPSVTTEDDSGSASPTFQPARSPSP